MKHLLKITAAVLLISIASCGGKKINSPIVGKWKLVKMEIPKVDLTSELNTNVDSLGITGVDTAIKTMAEGMEKLTNVMSGMGEAMVNGFLKGSIYTFEDNGEVKVSQFLMTQKGKYSLSNNDTEVLVTMEGKDILYTVKSIDDKQMVLKSSVGEEWIFEKK